MKKNGEIVFKQIAIGGTEDYQMYGLDEHGIIWYYSYKEDGWIRHSMTRLELE